MIRAGFLTPNDRAALTKLARDGSAAHRLARRADALLLLDGGWSCVEVAEALLLDDDTVLDWHKLYVEGGLARFESGGSASHLSKAQEKALDGCNDFDTIHDTVANTRDSHIVLRKTPFQKAAITGFQLPTSS